MKNTPESGGLQDIDRMLTDEEADQVSGGVWCSYALALIAIHWMTGVYVGSFVCDDGTIV